MSVSRNSAGALILAAALLAGHSGAQDGGVFSRDPAAAPLPPPDAGPQDPAPGGVEVRPLDATDPSQTGTLSEADGGLGGALWAGSDYATVAELMSELPVATSSPAMNDLARRLLLTGAKPDDAGGQGDTLFVIRTRKLDEAGLTRDLAGLLAAGGAKSGDPTARVDALLLEGQTAEACAVDLGDGGLMLQLRALCQIADGDAPAAAMSADLARVKGVDDPAFFALVAHLADGAPLDGAALKNLTPITYALAEAAAAKLGPAALENADPGIVAALASDDAQSAELRATAAERAGQVGALPAGAVIDILRALKTGKAESDALAGAERLQKAIATEGLEPRAQAIVAALDQAAKRNLTTLYAQLLARAAWEMPPSATLAPYADAITRILLLSGRGDRIADWLNVAETLSARVRDELAVRLAIAAPTRDRAVVALSALVRLVQESEHDEALSARVLIYAGALDALGYAIPSSAQSLLQSSPLLAGSSAGQVETADLAAAARDKRTGETLLRALILLGRGGPAQAHPATVNDVVAALATAGFQREASAVALEAALARATPGEGG
ncbi:MAG: hypothetical protein IT548_16000 [Alphaproteobacteria bacterium]|nr:hypothetical protein [Alphaproteobacteria bacterium]